MVTALVPNTIGRGNDMNSEMSLDENVNTQQLLCSRLARDMIERRLPYGEQIEFDKPTEVYARGIRNWDFFIVLRGEVSVPSLTNDDEIILSSIDTMRENSVATRIC
jgi:hypothetical protein